MNLLAYLLARLKEPSSYAGIGALAAALGLHLPDATLSAALQFLTAALGLLAVLFPEKGAQPDA